MGGYQIFSNAAIMLAALGGVKYLDGHSPSSGLLHNRRIPEAKFCVRPDLNY